MNDYWEEMIFSYKRKAMQPSLVAWREDLELCLLEDRTETAW